MPYVASGRSKLYYEEFGEGPAVLFAHGVGGNHASWFNQVPEFSKRYRTIVIDHRAFGNSDDVEEIGASGYVDDLVRVLDELKVDRVRLVAQSMGGGTCAAFTCRFPERVVALAHCDSLAGAVLPAPHDAELSRVNKSNDSLTQAERVLGPKTRLNDLENTLLYLQIASFNSVTRRTLKGKLPRWSPSELGATGVPILFVAGEDDIICPPGLIRIAHAAIPESRFEVLQGVGHSAYFEDPHAFNALILSFLEGLDADSPAAAG